MNGDDHHLDVDPKELNTPVEILEAASLGCIETLRRKRICFYPGPRVPPQPGEIIDFGQCVRYLGSCNALIFCAPHHRKETALARIHHYIHGGDPGLEFDYGECVTDFDFIWKDDLMFPNKADNLLVGHQAPNEELQVGRPPDSQFWAHFAVLSIVGRNEKLYLLHLGLHGDYAWPYFLEPCGIRAERIIADL